MSLHPINGPFGSPVISKSCFHHFSDLEPPPPPPPLKVRLEKTVMWDEKTFKTISVCLSVFLYVKFRSMLVNIAISF